MAILSSANLVFKMAAKRQKKKKKKKESDIFYFHLVKEMILGNND